MEAFLSAAGDIFTAAIGWVSTVGSTIVANPVLLTFTALPLCGIGIGFFRRLINVN